MTYKKPNVRYVDMCMWIDNNIYNDDVDVDKAYKYLYHLAMMFARKKKWFYREEDLDEFSLYAATEIFMRYKKIQSNKDDDVKIKSVLNYMKSRIFPLKVDFTNSFLDPYYRKKISFVPYPNEYTESFLSDITRELERCDFRCCLGDIIQTIKMYLNKIQYNNGTSEFHNIYMSCLLTVLNSITLSKRYIVQLQKKRIQSELTQFAFECIYSHSKNSKVILYNLCKDFNDYIEILKRELNQIISQDLRMTLNTDLDTETNIKNILISELDVGQCIED